MDALLRVVKKSPSKFTNTKHSKIPEGWGENKETVVDGITFYLKYIGSTLVEEIDSDQTYGDGISAKAVHNITLMAKSAGKKLRKTALTVSPKGIRTVDMTTNQVMFESSIYRISFCTADKTHNQIFAYIARNTTNETMECYAFLCAREKIAQAVTLTVSQAFSVAQDRWLENKLLKKSLRENGSKEKTESKQSSQINSQSSIGSFTNTSPTPALISSTPTPPSTPEILSDSTLQKTFCTTSRQNWESFDDSADDNIDDMFSRLAERRSKPSFNTDLKEDELDDSVQKYMEGSACYEAFSRTVSMDDLLSL
nr:low density lipoprotein receptor adapter protein 1-B-like [Biomphalaria glabrata]